MKNRFPLLKKKPAQIFAVKHVKRSSRTHPVYSWLIDRGLLTIVY